MPATNQEPLIEPTELAARIKIPLATLYQWRSKGVGPPSFKIGRHVRYRVVDVEQWLEEQREA